MGASPYTLYCSFCGKSQHEVKKLVAGPTVFICDECVDLCMSICQSDDVLSEDAAAAADEWSHRTVALRQTIDALSSQNDDAIEPIRGPWIMTASRDTVDGSVHVVLKHSSPDDGDISIAFTETVEDLTDIAAWVATEKEGGPRPKPAHARITEGIEFALWMSGKALLREYERRFALLKLEELLRQRQAPPEQSLPTDVTLLRDGINSIIERHPEHRHMIAQTLREMLYKLAYTR